MKLLTRGTAAFDQAISFLVLVASIIIILVMLIVCTEVVMRYFLRSPIAWAVQFAEYGPFFIAFLSAAWILKRERHVKMDVVIF